MNDQILAGFSVAIGLFFAGWIIVPYLRGKSDLLTARNFFLAGGILYLSLSGINSASGAHYYMYPSSTLWLYIVGVVVFLLSFWAGNSKLKFPVRAGRTWLQRWPADSGFALGFIFVVCLGILVLQTVASTVPSIGRALMHTNFIVPVFATALGLRAWSRQKMNPIAIGIVLAAVALGAYNGFASGGGRRTLYVNLVSVPVCLYWWVFRTWKPRKVIFLAIMGAVAIPFLDAAYRAVRWYGVIGVVRLNEEEGAAARWSKLKDVVSSGNTVGSFVDNILAIGHNAVENSLVTVYLTTSGRGVAPEFQREWFLSPYCLITMPIPRSSWEEKPEMFGLKMPYTSGVLEEKVKTNWGPGIVGHGFYEGGLLVLALYGLLAGASIRFMDELVLTHPEHPLVIGCLTAMSVQLVGWIRGDIVTMTMLAVLPFLIMLILRIITLMFAGNQASEPLPNTGYPQTPNLLGPASRSRYRHGY